MKAGDVFCARLSFNEPKRHFWVVVLAITADDKAILGNITSDAFDHTLYITSGEYGELTQDKSYLNYPKARVEAITSLQEKLKRKEIFAKKPVSADLLKQIQEGLLRSKHTPKDIKQLFRDNHKK